MTRAKLILTAFLGFTLSTLALPSTGSAMSTYYATYCTGCHGSTVATCNGCHMHGGQSVSGSIAKTSFAPGEAMSITVNAGTRTGWWRAAILDQANAVVARATVSSGLTTTISVPAPQTAGTYSWKVAWYGNQRDANPPSGSSWLPDANNANHGFQMASLPAFSVVAATAPSPVATLSASSLAFGNVTVGQSASRAATLGNTGNATLSVTAVAPCSNTAPPYAMSPNAAFTVAAGASRTLTVTFAPTSTGTFTGCFDLFTNDPKNATVRVAVSGAGTAVATPSATLNPVSLAFGDVTVGQAVTKTATVGNTGAAALAVSGVTACDASNSASLSVTPTAAFSVAAGGSQVLTVRFAPTTAGAAAGCWNVATNDPAHASLQLRASGNGVASAPTPTPACGTCHPIPPNTGRHYYHRSEGIGCGRCHGTGYSSTTVNSATHNNGTVNVATSTGWSSTTASCSNSCHGTKSWGTATTPPPTGSCGSCHAIPPNSGRHLLHKSEGIQCSQCHGSGYSTTTVNTTTHRDGKVNLRYSTGWRSSTRSCSNSCHGTESWYGTSSGGGDDDDHDRGDDDFVLGGDEETASAGCSSAGTSTTLLTLAAIGALATLRRRRRA